MSILCNFSSIVRLEKIEANEKQHLIFFCKNTEVNLCRNMEKEICIELKPLKCKKKYIYKLENFKSSSKFLKDGNKN